MALTKAEMAEHLFEKLGINKRDAKDLVELFFEEIKGALEAGEQVKLSGFGNFDLLWARWWHASQNFISIDILGGGGPSRQSGRRAPAHTQNVRSAHLRRRFHRRLRGRADALAQIVGSPHHSAAHAWAADTDGHQREDAGAAAACT